MFDSDFGEPAYQGVQMVGKGGEVVVFVCPEEPDGMELQRVDVDVHFDERYE